MGRIVTGDQRRPVVSRDKAPTRTKWTRRNYRVAIYGHEINRVEENLRILRDHFGVNTTQAWRIALQLTANAIRHNRAMPDVG